MYVASGDLLKLLEIQLTLSAEPFPIEVDDDLVLRWETPDGSVVQVVPALDDAATGRLTYQFLDGQTDLPGVYRAQVTLTRDAKPLSFPDDGSRFLWTVTDKI